MGINKYNIIWGEFRLRNSDYLYYNYFYGWEMNNLKGFCEDDDI